MNILESNDDNMMKPFENTHEIVEEPETMDNSESDEFEEDSSLSMEAMDKPDDPVVAMDKPDDLVKATDKPNGCIEDIDPDEPTYCLCDQVSYGDMIGCDNDLCPIEWFHFNCVQLTSKPKGRWYCPKCRGDKVTVMKPKAQFLKELEKYNKEREMKMDRHNS